MADEKSMSDYSKIWFGLSEPLEREPGPVRLEDTRTVTFEDGIATLFISNDTWDLGLYFMGAGMDTIVFSLEERDDGTADEWYGPSHEFYYILMGEFKISYDRDAEKLRKRSSPHFVVRAGEAARFAPGWKYQVKNTGNVPGAFFWGKSAPPRGTEERLMPPKKR